MLAKGNEKDIKGIEVNAFSEPFVLDRVLFDAVGSIESDLEGEGNNNG